MDEELKVRRALGALGHAEAVLVTARDNAGRAVDRAGKLAQQHIEAEAAITAARDDVAAAEAALEAAKAEAASVLQEATAAMVADLEAGPTTTAEAGLATATGDANAIGA